MDADELDALLREAHDDQPGCILLGVGLIGTVLLGALFYFLIR